MHIVIFRSVKINHYWELEVLIKVINKYSPQQKHYKIEQRIITFLVAKENYYSYTHDTGYSKISNFLNFLFWKISSVERYA